MELVLRRLESFFSDYFFFGEPVTYTLSFLEFGRCLNATDSLDIDLNAINRNKTEQKMLKMYGARSSPFGKLFQ